MASSVFFDRQDHELLHMVNMVLEKDQNVSSRYTQHLFDAALHPHGIKELAVSNDKRIAYAVINLLSSLEVGQAKDRLMALNALYEEVIFCGNSQFRFNTGRVLIQIMKELVRSYGDKERQLKLAHDFRLATSGRPRVIRAFLKRYYLLEMPEAWNQVTFDHHVHDANTKGRKSPTHLIMDAWIKGIRSLTVIYYNYVPPSAVQELMQAAKIMGITAHVGVEYKAIFRGRYVNFIWEPTGFADHNDMLAFLSEPKTLELMEQGRAASRYQEQFVLSLLDKYNTVHRFGMEKLFGVSFPEISYEKLKGYVSFGQPSRLHLAGLIHQTALPDLKKRYNDVKAEMPVATAEKRRALQEVLDQLCLLDPDEILEIWLGKEQNPGLPWEDVPPTAEDAPELLRLPAYSLLNRLAAVRSNSSITLSLAGLRVEDVLEILYNCGGMISKIELFNLKEHAEGNLLYTEEISALQQAINSGSPVFLKRLIHGIIRNYGCALDPIYKENGGNGGAKAVPAGTAHAESAPDDITRPGLGTESAAESAGEDPGADRGHPDKTGADKSSEDRSSPEKNGPEKSGAEKMGAGAAKPAAAPTGAANALNYAPDRASVMTSDLGPVLTPEFAPNMAFGLVPELAPGLEANLASGLEAGLAPGLGRDPAREQHDGGALPARPTTSQASVAEAGPGASAGMPRNEILHEEIFHEEMSEEKAERCRHLTEILRNIPRFKSFYQSSKLGITIGSDSTSRSNRLHGMGFGCTDTLPPRSQRQIFVKSPDNLRQLLFLQQKVSQRTTYIRREHLFLHKRVLELVRSLPGCRHFMFTRQQDWVVNASDITADSRGNLATLGGFQRDHPIQPCRDTRHKRGSLEGTNDDLRLGFSYLSTILQNILKVLAGFVPACLTFQYTQDWWVLAWFGPVLWFGITGLRNIVQAVVGGGGISRSPLLRWNNFVSWNRLCDSLMYTGLSVPLLELGVRHLLLEGMFGIDQSNAPLIFFTVISTVNGFYIAAHNAYRGFPKEAIIGNLFRSVLAIPVSLVYNQIFMFLFQIAMPETAAVLILQSGAIVSKISSDTVAGIIEGLADRASNLRMRHWDCTAKLRQFFDCFAQLELLLPEEENVLEILARPKDYWGHLGTEIHKLEKNLIINSLDLMYFWFYQPRGRHKLRLLIKEMTPEERAIFCRSQLVLSREQEVSQLFVDGITGRNFARPLSFYLDRVGTYLKELSKASGVNLSQGYNPRV